MPGGRHGRKRFGWLALAVLCALVIGGLAGCGGTTGGTAGQTALKGADLEQAERLYAQLKRENSLHRDRKSLDLAASLLDYYPSFNRNDEVLLLAVESAARLADTDRALTLTDELLQRYPDSALIDQTLLQGADLSAAAGDTLRAAGYLITYHDRDPARSLRSDGKPRAAVYLETLSSDELGQLMVQYPASELWTYLGYLRVKDELEAGRYPEADDTAARLQAQKPTDRWTVAALELVSAGSGEERRYLQPVGEVKPNQVGVLVPLTGRFAVLGNAFYDAAMLATTAANLEFGTDFSLQLEDSGADPVQGALAARKLCDEDGSIALLGGLLSAPTAATAVVCDIYGVPLISPTATNDNIWELGPAVFQTNITGLYEVRLLAQLATTIMLKKRFAIIHPDTPEGRRHALVFTNEVESLGGEVVANVSFPEQGTDFKDPILALRKTRPEVVFAPATVDQMVLLGPQLDFYKAGALVLGLSNWNSNKLRDHSGTVLERAVFPDDLALFPSRWEAEFKRAWNAETYPPEATALALKVYQSTRMLLDTLVQSGARTRRHLAEALTRRLSNQDLELAGPESFGPTMRMFRGQHIVRFPAELFATGWDLTEGAAADSLSAAPDSLGQVPVEAESVPEVNGQG